LYKYELYQTFVALIEPRQLTLRINFRFDVLLVIIIVLFIAINAIFAINVYLRLTIQTFTLSFVEQKFVDTDIGDEEQGSEWHIHRPRAVCTDAGFES